IESPDTRRSAPGSTAADRARSAGKGYSMGLRTCVSSWRPGTEENNESDTEHSGGQRLRIGRSRGARAGGDGHVTHALRMRNAPGARGRQPTLFGYLRLWRQENSVRLQLLSHQARRRISTVGYRPRHDGTQCRAEGEPG